MIRSNRHLFKVFPTIASPHWDIPTRNDDILLGYGLSNTILTSNVVLEYELLWIYNDVASKKENLLMTAQTSTALQESYHSQCKKKSRLTYNLALST